ncbi:MAG TPA: energy-coupling factor transporter transmembrane component T [Candidatus Saccharimonadaceae bacterium]|jgi:energy-coupling factor transport system permease protein|nr:energy-coupling factor transporter transmembrane component T [Candidatus Saccharimonadaceae bacterium]
MTPFAAASESRAAWGPVLLGALVGAPLAGHWTGALACGVVAAFAAARAGAERPGGPWFRLLAGGTLASLALNAYLNSGTRMPGPVLFGRAPTWDGLVLGAWLALRVWGAAIALHGLRAAWPGERAADELGRLLRPLEALRVPIGEARAVLALALRFRPLLVGEAKRIGELQALRAGRPARGFRERWARRRAAAMPTLVGALERSEQVALALEARHFRVRPARRPPWRAWAGVTGGALALGAALWRGR